MKYTIAILALASHFAFAATEVQNYKIDNAHASVIFKVSHLGFSDVYGTFSGIDGKFTINEAQPDKSTLDLTIKADSVSTLNPKRDDHLRGPDFFNVKQNPEIKFKSTKVKKAAGMSYEITGDMTLNGVTKPLIFTFNQTKTGKDPWGNTRTGGSTNFTIKRSDYKMNFMNKPGEVGDEVQLMVSVEGIRQ